MIHILTLSYVLNFLLVLLMLDCSKKLSRFPSNRKAHQTTDAII